MTSRPLLPEARGDERVEAAISRIGAGGMVVLNCDAEGLPGVVCAAAELITPELVTFMATEARGLISLGLTPDRCDELRLALMRPTDDAADRPPYTVSIEARAGVSTGISASDRAHTIRVSVDPRTRPIDLVSPGHIFPVRTHARGVLLKARHAEAAVDLARLAGLTPAGVTCAILDDDGALAAGADLDAFCARHGLTTLRVSDLVRHRLRSEAVVERTMDSILTTRHGEFRALGYVSPFDSGKHLALLKGDVAAAAAADVRVHRQPPLPQVVGEPRSVNAVRLAETLQHVNDEGCGVVVCVAPRSEDDGDGDFTPAELAIVAEILSDIGLDPSPADALLVRDPGAPSDERLERPARAELRLERMTSPEVATAVAAGADTVVLPCAAIEQHGPHLPLSVDSDHADRLAVLVAERLGNALVAPTLRLGCSAHHLGFAGTISLRPETLEALYADCCESLARHGFRRIVVFSGHIGNYPVLEEMASRLAAAMPDGVELVVFTDRAAILGAWQAAVEETAGLGERVGGHADIAESSIMLALRPESVRSELIAPGFGGAPNDQTLRRLFSDGIGAIAPNGVLGDPRGMSAAVGQACLDAVTKVLVDFVEARGRIDE